MRTYKNEYVVSTSVWVFICVIVILFGAATIQAAPTYNPIVVEKCNENDLYFTWEAIFDFEETADGILSINLLCIAGNIPKKVIDVPIKCEIVGNVGLKPTYVSFEGSGYLACDFPDIAEIIYEATGIPVGNSIEYTYFIVQSTFRPSAKFNPASANPIVSHHDFGFSLPASEHSPIGHMTTHLDDPYEIFTDEVPEAYQNNIFDWHLYQGETVFEPTGGTNLVHSIDGKPVATGSDHLSDRISYQLSGGKLFIGIDGDPAAGAEDMLAGDLDRLYIDPPGYVIIP